MMLLFCIWLGIVLVAVGAALIYRSQAKMLQVYAKSQQQRADAAEAINNNRQQLDTDLATLHQIHRKEIIHDNSPENLALRADFDNDWSSDARLRDANPAADHSNSFAASGSTGAAGHQVDRVELSE